MSEGETIDELEPCILVEGPRWADIKFYARWLLAVARADEFWKKAIKDPVFKKQVDRLLERIGDRALGDQPLELPERHAAAGEGDRADEGAEEDRDPGHGRHPTA